MSRAPYQIAVMECELIDAFKVIRAGLDPKDGTREDIALATLETFATLALRVMKKTNPSRIVSEFRTVEIAARMNGTPVYSIEGEPA